MFAELGDEYPDQETRYMQRDGYILVDKPELTLYLSPSPQTSRMTASMRMLS